MIVLSFAVTEHVRRESPVRQQTEPAVNVQKRLASPHATATRGSVALGGAAALALSPSFAVERLNAPSTRAARLKAETAAAVVISSQRISETSPTAPPPPLSFGGSQAKGDWRRTSEQRERRALPRDKAIARR